MKQLFRVHIIGKEGLSHHTDYARVLENYYLGAKYFSHPYLQVFGFFTLGRLILLDLEFKSLKFFPILFLRNLLFLKTDVYAVSIASWAHNRPTYGRVGVLIWMIKKTVFRLLSKTTNTRVFYTSKSQYLEYHNSTFVDFQYWDLKLLRDENSYLEFSERFKDIDTSNALLFIGRYDEYRGSQFVFTICNEHDALPFQLIIWSSTIDRALRDLVDGRRDVILIHSGPSSQDIINAHLFFKNHLLYYPNGKRTSGYFGRGIQSGNFMYISPNNYLEGYEFYPRAFRVRNTKELFAAFEANKSRRFIPNLVCQYPYEVD